MWLWSAEYARRGIGAITFYVQLDPARRRLVDQFLEKIDKAADAPKRKRRTKLSDRRSANPEGPK